MLMKVILGMIMKKKKMNNDRLKVKVIRKIGWSVNDNEWKRNYREYWLMKGWLWNEWCVKIKKMDSVMMMIIYDEWDKLRYDNESNV